MVKYLTTIQSLEAKFLSWEITQIPRAENSKTNRLFKHASTSIPYPEKIDEKVLMEYLPKRARMCQKNYN